MQITFLGTGAAEGIPSPFCECDTCRHARVQKGINVRRRSSVLINHDLLIDLGPDIVTACAAVGQSLCNLRYILVTHSHFDHFYPYNLEIRAERYCHDNTLLTPLILVAGPSTLHALSMTGMDDTSLILHRHPMLPFQTVDLPPYCITSIAASHAREFGDAMNYIIDDGANKLLYATDSGVFDDRSWQVIADQGFDAVILDATNGEHPTSNNHLNHERLQW